MGINEVIDGMNKRVEGSFIGRFFEFRERDAQLSKEFKGACTAFLASSYILAVNPRILADSGGPCVPSEEGGIFAPEYESCMFDVRKQYVTATAIASMVGCLLMGIMANLPILLSCGMGMNAYFTYNVVGWRGTGSVSWSAAVTAVLIEGFIFAFLSITGVRYAIVKLIPEPVRIATPAGIGAFLAHLGLQTAEGVGVVVGDIATAVTLGGCPPEYRTPIIAYDEACQENAFSCVTSDNYTCDVKGGIMTSGTMWIGLLGLYLTALLLSYRCKAAFLISIGLVTIVSWFRNTPVTYFPDNDEGNARFDYFKQVVAIEPVNKLFFQFTGELSQVALALITFLYIDFLDTSGTLFALASQLGYVNNEGDFPRSRWAFTADALATAFGSLFGLSPVTSYIESAAGVEAGARTGLAAVFCGFFFFLSIFFAPILANIPPWATGGCLIVVGALMCKSLKKIQWEDPAHAITAFLTVILMPLTYSIAYGLIGGLMFWFSLQAAFMLSDLAGIDRYMPTTEEDKNVQEEIELKNMESEEFSGNVKQEKPIEIEKGSISVPLPSE